MAKILVVDDDVSIISFLQEALPALGYGADYAESGQDAIQLLEDNVYDLILSDIRMPEKNGIDVARAAYKLAPHAPMLFMSGNPNTIVEDRSFLAKPFTVAELELRIDTALRPPEDEENVLV